MSKTKTNWAGILFWGALIGILGLAVWWQKDTLLTWIQKPTLPNISQLSQQLTLDNAITFFQKYGTLITVGVTGITTVYGFYMKHKANVADLAKIEAENKNIELELLKNSEINTALSSAETWKSKYESLAGDNTLLDTLQSTVAGKDTEITKLRSQMELLNQQNKQLQDEITVGTKVLEKVIVK